MKRIPLAALLALGVCAFARADEGAYKNLVGMAQAAATDRGPDADDAPERAPAPNTADPAPAAVLAPAVSKPRLWTRLYSTLLPAWRSPSSLRGAFEPAVSTIPARALMISLPALLSVSAPTSVQ